jgi:hypothetical protein
LSVAGLSAACAAPQHIITVIEAAATSHPLDRRAHIFSSTRCMLKTSFAVISWP